MRERKANFWLTNKAAVVSPPQQIYGLLLLSVSATAGISFYYRASALFIEYRTGVSKDSIVTNARCMHHHGLLTAEGIGSFFQHFKTSAILAHYAKLNLDLVGIDGKSSEHNYGYLEVLPKLQCERPLRQMDQFDPTCIVDNQRLEQLIPSICRSTLLPERILDALHLSHCQDIFHNITDELHQDLNDCMSGFYRDALSIEPTYSRSTELKIGIHLRWGDKKNSDLSVLSQDHPLDWRSISPQMAILALQNIETIGCGSHQVKIYMKDGIAIQGLPYPIIDSGNDIDDLIDYMSNDVLIQGCSSYPILATFAVGNKIVRTSTPLHKKYNQDNSKTNQIFGVHEKIVISCPFQSYGRNLAKH